MMDAKEEDERRDAYTKEERIIKDKNTCMKTFDELTIVNETESLLYTTAQALKTQGEVTTQTFRDQSVVSAAAVSLVTRTVPFNAETQFLAANYIGETPIRTSMWDDDLLKSLLPQKGADSKGLDNDGGKRGDDKDTKFGNDSRHPYEDDKGLDPQSHTRRGGSTNSSDIIPMTMPIPPEQAIVVSELSSSTGESSNKVDTSNNNNKDSNAVEIDWDDPDAVALARAKKRRQLVPNNDSDEDDIHAVDDDAKADVKDSPRGRRSPVGGYGKGPYEREDHDAKFSFRQSQRMSGGRQDAKEFTETYYNEGGSGSGGTGRSSSSRVVRGCK